MTTINLFDTASEQFKTFRFPGGECHIKFDAAFAPESKVRINARLNTSDDIMLLHLTVDALRRMEVSYIELFIPYLPYARQDRVMVPGEPLSVKVMTGLLNALKCDKVILFDVHSEVSTALLENVKNISNTGMVQHFITELKLQDFLLVSPDLGAYKKITKLAQGIGYTSDIVTGLKVRNLATGQIIKTDIDKDNLEGKPCLIVDDICDGGRTFMELAQVLKERNAGDLYLIVSHGIFSHDALSKLKATGFLHVCSSNSITDRAQDDFHKEYNLFK
jgi:ribose-phosphate pyrophosphokinase